MLFMHLTISGVRSQRRGLSLRAARSAAFAQAARRFVGLRIAHAFGLRVHRPQRMVGHKGYVRVFVGACGDPISAGESLG